MYPDSGRTRKAIAAATSSAVPMRPLGIAAIADARTASPSDGGHLGLDETGGHRVDGDVPARDLARQRLGEPDQPGLRGRVVGLTGVADDAGDARHVDDAAESLTQHGTERGAADVKRGGEIDGDHGIPVVVGEAHRQVVAGDPGVVDHDVDAPERRDGLLDERPRRRFGSARSAPSATAVASWSERSAATTASALSGCAEYPTATDAPARASAIAVALPMPRDAPVTRARLPSSARASLILRPPRRRAARRRPACSPTPRARPARCAARAR